MLGENPDIMTRLREEIITHVGLERPPTYDDLRSMKFLRAFVNGTHFSSCDYYKIIDNHSQKHYDFSHLCKLAIVSPTTHWY